MPSSAFTGATYHIGEQIGHDNASNVTPATGDFRGYASGIYEQSGNNGDQSVGTLYNQSPNDVRLSFKADNSLSALFSLTGAGDTGAGDNDHGGAKLYFGDWDNARGRSAAINGNIYAAVESARSSMVNVSYGDSGFTHPTQADASLYLVSGALLNPNALPCDQCDFMKWGTWGGQLKFRDGSQFGPGDNVTADINLGWYVAGNLTTIMQLNALSQQGVTAQYNGGVIGNVASFQPNGAWATYVATGNLTMNWNFGPRTGDLTISNFDNRSYKATNLAQLNPNINKFAGSLSQIGGTGIPNLTASAGGSFVNNGSTPAAGVIGDFNLHGGGYQATGVFAGAR